MSRLYASIDSDARKTQATSRGHKHIDTHTRGWDLGVRVIASHDQIRRDEDVFEVYVTSGSNERERDTLIGRVAMHNGRRYFYPVDTTIYRGNGFEPDEDDSGGISPEGLALGHRYEMGNVNAYCPKCSEEESHIVDVDRAQLTKED